MRVTREARLVLYGAAAAVVAVLTVLLVLSAMP